jgi:hypothetical protein
MDEFTVERHVVWTLYRNGEPIVNAHGQIATFESEMEARKAADNWKVHGAPYQSLTERADMRPRSRSGTIELETHEDEDNVVRP